MVAFNAGVSSTLSATPLPAQDPIGVSLHAGSKGQSASRSSILIIATETGDERREEQIPSQVQEGGLSGF